MKLAQTGIVILLAVLVATTSGCGIINRIRSKNQLNEAAQAYQQLLDKNPKDEEAYKAIAYLYGAIKEDDKLRQWISQRAASDSTDPIKRAEAYIVLASKDWDCSYKITELPTNKITTVDPANNK